MGKMHAEGVTLIELLVALGVLATLLALGVPAFSDFLAANRMGAAANDVVSALHLARSEAVKRRATVVFCASDNATAAAATCSGGATPSAGWLVFADTNTDASVNPGEIIVSAHGPLPPEIAANSAWNNSGDGAPFYVAFNASGFRSDLAAAGSRSLADLQLCDTRGDRDTGGGIAAGRWVQIAATGRPQLFRAVAQLQGAANPLGGC